MTQGPRQVSDIITSVKNRISLPENDDRFDNSEIVRIANEVMEETILPKLMQYNEEYLLMTEVVPLRDINEQVIYDSGVIPIPRRAYGQQIRHMFYIDTNGDYKPIPYVSPTEEDHFRNRGGFSFYDVPSGYYFIADSIKLMTDMDSLSGSLLIRYVMKSPELVNNTTEFATVDDIDYDVLNQVATFVSDSVGTEIDTYCQVGEIRLFDVYRRETGAIMAADIAMTRTTTTNFQAPNFTEAETNNLANYQLGGYPVDNGSGTYSAELYLVPAGRNQFSPLPREYDNVLVLHVCDRILEAMGDTEGLQVNQNKIAKAERTLTSAFGKRDKGQSKIITNRSGLMTYSRSRRYYNRGY